MPLGLQAESCDGLGESMRGLTCSTERLARSTWPAPAAPLPSSLTAVMFAAPACYTLAQWRSAGRRKEGRTWGGAGWPGDELRVGAGFCRLQVVRLHVNSCVHEACCCRPLPLATCVAHPRKPEDSPMHLYEAADMAQHALQHGTGKLDSTTMLQPGRSSPGSLLLPATSN